MPLKNSIFLFLNCLLRILSHNLNKILNLTIILVLKNLNKKKLKLES